VALWVKVVQLLLPVALHLLVPAAVCALALALLKAAPAISALLVDLSAMQRIRVATLTLLVVIHLMVAVSLSVPAQAVVRCFSLAAMVVARGVARSRLHPVLAWLLDRGIFRLPVRFRPQGAVVFRPALVLSQAVPRDRCRSSPVLLGVALRGALRPWSVPALPAAVALLSSLVVPAVLKPVVVFLWCRDPVLLVAHWRCLREPAVAKLPLKAVILRLTLAAARSMVVMCNCARARDPTVVANWLLVRVIRRLVMVAFCR
jgi:hypothetical protein